MFWLNNLITIIIVGPARLSETIIAHLKDQKMSDSKHD